jgi:hypothetical protein
LPGSFADLEGHGGILQSREALDLTMATIRSHAVPPDQRGPALRVASDVVSQAVDREAKLVLGGICALCIIGGIAAFARRTLRRALPWPPLSG